METPRFDITPECELILKSETDETKRYLIKQTCLATQQNDHQIRQQSANARWSEAHERKDLEEFAEIRASLKPLLSAWNLIVSVKGVLVAILTAIAFPILVAFVQHALNWK